jgi:hypothetical protein
MYAIKIHHFPCYPNRAQSRALSSLASTLASTYTFPTVALSSPAALRGPVNALSSPISGLCRPRALPRKNKICDIIPRTRPQSGTWIVKGGWEAKKTRAKREKTPGAPDPESMLLSRARRDSLIANSAVPCWCPSLLPRSGQNVKKCA